MVRLKMKLTVDDFFFERYRSKKSQTMNFKRLVFFLDLYYESTVFQRLFSSRDLSPFNYQFHFESNKYCYQIQQRAESEYCS